VVAFMPPACCPGPGKDIEKIPDPALMMGPRDQGLPLWSTSRGAMMNRSNNQRRPRLPGGLESVNVTARRQDDIDGGPANETVQFGLGGADYEIDLSTKNAVAFRKQLAPFLDHARKAGRVQLHRPARSAASRQRSGRYPGMGERPWHRRQRAWAYPGQRGGAIPGRGRRAWENQRPAPGANQTQFQVLIAFVRSG
jgi:hypothetical protein